jgi:hypothetical protein
MAAPILLRECENWALSRTDKKENRNFEMKFLRKFAGHTLLAEISNPTIQNELEMFNISDKITNQKEN